MSATFDQFVDQLTLSAPKDYSRELREWKKHLGILYKNIESYLKPYLKSGKIKISYEDKQIKEEMLGVYTVKSAIIAVGAQRIHLDPIGTFIIAAKGRVDMVGPRATVRLVLVDKNSSGPRIRVHTLIGDEKPPAPAAVLGWSWKIALPPPKIHYIDLDQDVFQDAMMRVANV